MGVVLKSETTQKHYNDFQAAYKNGTAEEVADVLVVFTSAIQEELKDDKAVDLLGAFKLSMHRINREAVPFGVYKPREEILARDVMRFTANAPEKLAEAVQVAHEKLGFGVLRLN